MQVIGAGFGRTGTLSLKVALERLGFDPCYHMTEVMDKPEHAEFWARAPLALERGEQVNWETVFEGYRATVDFPGCVFYRELMEAYPQAKVLLTVRDPESWYESASQTILGGPKANSGFAGRVFFAVAEKTVPAFRRAPQMIQNVIIDRTFSGDTESREHVIGVFEEHIEEVKRAVPEEKLLVYSVKEGWEPLCEFLDVPVPDEPFPHVNERDDFQKLMAKEMKKTLIPAATALAGAVAAAFVGLRALGAGRKRQL